MMSSNWKTGVGSATETEATARGKAGRILEAYKHADARVKVQLCQTFASYDGVGFGG
jgi:hypothetical protein